MLKLDGTPITLSCRCSKCKGLIVEDNTLDENAYWVHILRCVNCGKVWVKLNEKVINYAYQTKDRRTDRMDELELYRTRRRNPKCHSNSI